VWVYVPKDPIPPDTSHPILQSYVDIIMRGCLSIHDDFARSFINTTVGWTDTSTTTKDLERSKGHWVNDRTSPLYPRADAAYSYEHGPVIDELLQTHPTYLVGHRVRYDSARHLNALAEALVTGRADPLALERVQNRLSQPTRLPKQ
jgi:hypothetical protein